MDIRRPLWLRRLDAPGAEAFAMLFGLESLSRALIVPLLPVAALEAMGDAQGVSLLFFGVSLFGLTATLVVPLLVRLLARRWVYTLGALCLGGASLTMMGDGLGFLAGGLALRVLGLVMTTICLSLYILDHISRDDFSRSEPMRLMFGGAAWMIGPAAGAFIADRFDPDVAFALSAAATVALLAYFWNLRIREASPLTRFQGRSPNPLRYLRQFASRPRLTYAWVSALGRYVWWVMFFVYVPLYAVESGLGQFVGGLLVSSGGAIMFALPLFGRAVRRFGMRAVLMAGFGAAGVLCLAAFWAAGLPWVAVGLLGLATVAMVSLDAVANMPFMLAVRRHERPEMTAVYSTYRDVGEVAAPGLFALLLQFAALPIVFAATGTLMLALSGLSRAVHPRLGRSRRNGRERQRRAGDRSDAPRAGPSDSSSAEPSDGPTDGPTDGPGDGPGDAAPGRAPARPT